MLGANRALDRVAPRSGPGYELTDRARMWLLDLRQADLLPVSASDKPVTFVISEGEGLAEVAERLAAGGLIRSADAFLLLARVRRLDRSVQAGEHTLSPGMTAEEVLRSLQVAPAEGVTVTLPEGLRMEEVAALLAGQGIVDAGSFLAEARAAGATGRPTVDQRPADASLEGYLFPDTYDFERDSSPKQVIDALLDAFEARHAQIQPSARPTDLSVHEQVILASIVEREAMLDEERPLIARVFLNRLDAPPYLLNADPTVQYALGFQPESGTWWKRPLLAADLDVESPYNSYEIGGLPPGPIASPGLASLEAVASPADGDWQYFVADMVACDGSHRFAADYEEHLRNVAAVGSGDCGR